MVQNLDHAILAEKLGYERIWSPEIPAFGHDIWVHLARVAERTERIGIDPAVRIPSYRHPMAQASAIATLEHIAPGRLMVAFGTGFTGRIAMGRSRYRGRPTHRRQTCPTDPRRSPFFLILTADIIPPCRDDGVAR